MRNLNDYVAREANKEEGCKGRFRYSPPCHNMILEWLNMNAEEWLKLVESFGGKFRCAVGSAQELESYALHVGIRAKFDDGL